MPHLNTGYYLHAGYSRVLRYPLRRAVIDNVTIPFDVIHFSDSACR